MYTGVAGGTGTIDYLNSGERNEFSFKIQFRASEVQLSAVGMTYSNGGTLRLADGDRVRFAESECYDGEGENTCDLEVTGRSQAVFETADGRKGTIAGVRCTRVCWTDNRPNNNTRRAPCAGLVYCWRVLCPGYAVLL